MYNIKQGFRNIWHNKMFSLASIATMAATIFLFGAFYSLVTNFSQMVKEAEQGVAVTVFFVDGVSQEQVDAIGDAIKARPEVKNYRYVSADEAWNSFKQNYFKNNENLADGFKEDNPLANSSNYQVFLNDVSEQGSLVEYLKTVDGVRQVNQSEVAAKTLSDFNRLLKYVSVGVVAILIAVAIFLINNTITVGISVRKEEISIMKLIGAKDRFIRSPFIVEGVVIGLLGALIPLVALFFMYQGIVGYVSGKFSFLSGMMDFIPIMSIFRILVPVSLVLGVGIGYLGSRMTLKRHLKV
ncbi:permease-like cell division protein FtsX [Shuttleworthella satelles]|uniref:Cell division protein FtsX n=1 Tax=Shuttleworthella satelles DSM 14600 TaxID=626523 RepID=C4GCE9_9FIRM|nr:permease-like cell division protein FtsX [Shuttleworthia satelles]EEP27649.1 efflux ABC transporter, permease protein [Shuttleworthia satelles DSM 14600]